MMTEKEIEGEMKLQKFIPLEIADKKFNMFARELCDEMHIVKFSFDNGEPGTVAEGIVLTQEQLAAIEALRWPIAMRTQEGILIEQGGNEMLDKVLAIIRAGEES